MLTRWSIENFKSFCDRTDISLAPITVFAGANSSGKSTIIQSMLLLKQTVQYNPDNRPLALNGPLLKLGTFDDVKNATSGSPHIGLGFALSVEDQRVQAQRAPYAGWGESPTYWYSERTVKSITGQFRWDVAPAKVGVGHSIVAEDRVQLQLQPELAFSTLDAELKTENSLPAHIDITRSEHARVLNFSFRAEIDTRSKDELLKPKPDGTITGASSRHFFPGQLLIEYDAAKERARRLASVVLGVEPFFALDPAQTISADVVRQIDQLIDQGSKSLFPHPLGDQGMRLDQLAQTVRFALRKKSPSSLNLPDLQAELERMLLKDEKPKSSVETAVPRAIARLLSMLPNIFVLQCAT